MIESEQTRRLDSRIVNYVRLHGAGEQQVRQFSLMRISKDGLGGQHEKVYF
jgi:hypothetical protein